MIRTVRRNDAASFCACSKGTTMNKRLATLCACGFALGLWNNLAYADDGVEVHLPRVEHDWMTAREMATTTRAMGLANNMSTSASGTSAIYHNPAAIASAMMYAIDAAYYYDNAATDKPGYCAFCSQSAPIKRKKNQRSKCCSKSSPGIRNQTKNRRIRVKRKQKCNQGNQKYCKAAYVQNFFFTCILFYSLSNTFIYFIACT